MSYTSLETYWSNAGLATSDPAATSAVETDFFPTASDYSMKAYIYADSTWQDWYNDNKFSDTEYAY